MQVKLDRINLTTCVEGVCVCVPLKDYIVLCRVVYQLNLGEKGLIITKRGDYGTSWGNVPWFHPKK